MTIRSYQQRWELIPLMNTNSPACRDVEDQKFIDLAITGQAHYLVTRDKALLDMDQELPFRVLDDHTFRSAMGRYT